MESTLRTDDNKAKLKRQNEPPSWRFHRAFPIANYIDIVNDVCQRLPLYVYYI